MKRSLALCCATASTVALLSGTEAPAFALDALNDEPHHAIQAGVDLGVQAVRDDTLVPLAHTGPCLSLVPRYFGDLPFGLLLADARLGLAVVVGAEGEMGAATTWGAHLSPLFFLTENEQSGIALGPALGWENETFYFADWDDAHAYWIGASWLGPRAHGRRGLNANWRLDFDAQFALLGFLSRSPGYRLKKQETSESVGDVLSWPTTSPRFATLLDFQVVRASVDFFHTQNRGRVPTGPGLGVELAFARAAEPKAAFSFESTLRFSYTWGL